MINLYNLLANTYFKSGASAGMGVDFILFPLDTIKTRLQSKKGFIGSGGFRGIYSGLSSTMVGSAPTAALFFTIYETSKKKMANYSSNQTFNQIISANIGEIVNKNYYLIFTIKNFKMSK